MKLLTDHLLFDKARLKLSLWYVIIILGISTVLSLGFYWRASQTLENEIARIEQRWIQSQSNPRSPAINRLMLSTNELRQAHYRLTSNLIMINLMVLVVTGLGSYFLSGKTLQPIAQTLSQQRRFVADAAHELRTPLASLKMAHEVLLLPNVSKQEMTDGLTTALADIEDLEHLIDMLLKLAQDAEQLKETLDDVQVGPILNKLHTQFAPIAKSEQVKLTMSKLPEPVTVKATPAILKEVISILVDNAIKFTPPKGVVTVATASNKRQTIIKVSDTGCGISPQDLPHIFDRFYRASAARTRCASRSHGLGLSLAKQLIILLDGSIQVESTPGEGSIFTIVLPS